MPIATDEIKIEPVDHEKFPVVGFDCKDSDLNEFLAVDCLRYRDTHLAHTKIALHNGRVVGFIAISADAITLIEAEWGWLRKKDIPIRQIPALKVGRLAVDHNFKGQDIGTILMRYAVGVAFRMNKEPGVGCRYLTVDAYPDSVGFYTKLGFVKSQHKSNKNRRNVNMYYDIISGPKF